MYMGLELTNLFKCEDVEWKETNQNIRIWLYEKLEKRCGNIHGWFRNEFIDNAYM